MSEKDPDLFKRMNTMSFDELTGYISTTKLAGKICAFSGISAILLALIFMNLYVVTLSGVVLYFFGKMAVGCDEIFKHATNLLEKKYR